MAIACTTSKRNSKQVEFEPTENLQLSGSQNSESKIVFLTIKITQTDSVKDTYSFKITNTILAEGQLKKNPIAAFSPEPNYLYCEILDDNKRRIDFIRVENPLLKVFEFNDKPGSQLEKRAFKSTQGEFFYGFN